MPRHSRKESSTGYYHVMLRGINQEFLFSKEANKKRLLNLIKEQQTAGLFELGAWCIMDNHAHMLLCAEINMLSKAIKIINLKYASYYNLNQNRTGPVFGDRFRSETIENDRYLLGVVRYIHNNPVKAGLVKSPTEHKWNSYKEYLYTPRYISSKQKNYLLSIFGYGLQDFSKFHAQDDDLVYIDTSESETSRREELAIKIINSICEKHGIANKKSIQANPHLFAFVCKKLVREIRLPLRRTAKHLETNLSKISRTLQEK